MTGVAYSDGTAIDYGYNEIGPVTTMTDKTGTTTYQYDDMQRLISTTDSNDKTVSYEYDILGRKTGITLPDDQTVSYAYDVMDRLIKVSDEVGIIAEYEYDANSQLIENTRNGITTTYDYNELGQLTQLTTSDVSAQIQKFSYQYDALGNIVEEVRTENEQVNNRTYSYDAANQLVEFSDNDYIEKYTYDNVGNMLTKDINGIITSYDYNAANQLTEQTTNGQTVGYKYNTNGDLTEKTIGEEYSYDIQGNLVSIKGNDIDKEYSYNGVGNRLSETTDGETIYYVNDINRHYEQVLQTYDEDGNVINTYTYGVQRINSTGNDDETYLYDGRGSIAGAVGEDGIMASYSYTAYGDLMPNSPTPKVFGYNAEATDYDTGIQYLRARYYDTSINRFFQKDDSRGKYIEPQTMNRYIYVGNNPSNRIDPSGHKWLNNAFNKVKDFFNRSEDKKTTTNNSKRSKSTKSNTQKSTVKSSNFYVDYYTRKATVATSDNKNELSTKEYLDKKMDATKNGQTIDQFNRSLGNDTVITPDELVYGEAGYTADGYYCSDLTDNTEYSETFQEYANHGVPSSASHYMAIHDMGAELMSYRDVNERNEMLDKAYEYINYNWTPTEDLLGWAGRHVYNEGQEYRGVPYSQGIRLPPSKFNESLDNQEFYDYYYKKSIEKSMPRYGQDCSGLVCDIWGQENYFSTKGFMEIARYAGTSYEKGIGDESYGGREIQIQIEKVGDYGFRYDYEENEYIIDTVESDFGSVAPGDAIVKDGHIRIVVGNDGENLICIEQTEFPGFAGTLLQSYKYSDLKGEYIPITKTAGP